MSHIELSSSRSLSRRNGNTGQPESTLLAIVQSDVFVDSAIFFLRKIENYTDTSIRLATDYRLKILARRFCHQSLERFFPDMNWTEISEADLIFEAVFRIFRDLKTDLLNKIRLKKPLQTIRAKSSTFPSNAKTTPRLAIGDTHPQISASDLQTVTVEVFPQSQDRSDQKSSVHGETCDVIDLCRDSMSDKESTTQDENHNFDDVALSNRPKKKRSSRVDQASHVREFIPQNRCSSVDFNELARSEIHRQLIEENDRLQVEIQTMLAYGKFVQTSLRVCYDTYLEETLTAKRACIYQKALQCNAVVETLKDLQSDLDPEGFQSHYLRYGSAPPSRYWLDGVQKRQQMYTIQKQ